MKKVTAICMVLLVGLLVIGAGRKPPRKEGEILASVNDEVLTLKEFNRQFEKMLLPWQIRGREEEAKEGIVEQWIETQLLLQEAKRRGINGKPDLLEKLREMEKMMIIQALVQEEMDKVKVSHKEVRGYFKQHQDRFRTPETARIKHILVKTQKEAKELRKRLNEGEEFEKLARKASIDARTKEQGGGIGLIDREYCWKRFGPGFTKAAFSMKKGEISQSIRSRRGYHLIKLKERFEAEEQTLDEARGQVKGMALQEKKTRAMQKFMEKLRKKAQIEKCLELLCRQPLDIEEQQREPE
ncbi:peptidyl-prolyl cis-trans isomerase [bacterium]|nr:peptidyl-prolyl cis-trans isomerase [bacterium]